MGHDIPAIIASAAYLAICLAMAAAGAILLLPLFPLFFAAEPWFIAPIAFFLGIIAFNHVSELKYRALASGDVRLFSGKRFPLVVPVPLGLHGLDEFLAAALVTGLQLLFLVPMAISLLDGANVWLFLSVLLSTAWGLHDWIAAFSKSARRQAPYVTIAVLGFFLAMLIFIWMMDVNIIAAFVFLCSALGAPLAYFWSRELYSHSRLAALGGAAVCVCLLLATLAYAVQNGLEEYLGVVAASMLLLPMISAVIGLRMPAHRGG